MLEFLGVVAVFLVGGGVGFAVGVKACGDGVEKAIRNPAAYPATAALLAKCYAKAGKVPPS